MKKRQSFVSNSSSSSFVIAKTFLNEKQVIGIRKWYEKEGWNDDKKEKIDYEIDDHGDGFEEDDNYIKGNYNNVYEEWKTLLKKLKIDKEKMFTFGS